MLKKLVSRELWPSLFMLVFSVAIMLHPNSSLLFFCKVLGWGMVLSGLVGLVMLNIHHKDNYDDLPDRYRYFTIGKNVFMTLAGVIFLTKSQMIISIVPFLVGLVMAFNGLVSSLTAFSKRHLTQNWQYSFWSGLLVVFLGGLILLNPFTAASALIFTMGLSVFMSAASNILTLIFLNQKQ